MKTNSGDFGEPERALPGPARFLTTHWSVVLAAGVSGSPAAQAALERLCATYRYPLYAFVRRQGESAEEAEDIVQGFFARVIEKNSFAQVDRSKGRFRAFLLACLKHFMADARDREHAAKRGGGQRIVSFDALTAEERYQREPADLMTPERLYDLQWAHTLAERARGKLREEYASAGKGELYDLLTCLEPGAAQRLTYAEIGRRLNKTESAIKNEAARFHQRFRELVRAEVAQTVASVPEIDEEIRHLRDLLLG